MLDPGDLHSHLLTEAPELTGNMHTHQWESPDQQTLWQLIAAQLSSIPQVCGDTSKAVDSQILTLEY